MTTSPARLAYLAGVLDYNNSILMRKVRGREVPFIHVSNTGHRHVYLLAKTFGGEVVARTNGLRVFQRSHTSAVEIVRKIRPYILINQKEADRVLDWVPAIPKRKIPKPSVVPCPKGCGGTMKRTSKMCLACFSESEQRIAAQYKPVPGKSLTMVGTGEVTQTPNGVIHRLRG